MKTCSFNPRFFFGSICVCLALLTNAAVFTTDVTIGLDDTTYEGEDIIVTNCTLTVDGAHSFASLLIQSNAVLTHSVSTNGLGLTLTVTGEVAIENGGTINLSGQGHSGGFGPGAGVSVGSPASGGGAGHGGFGGQSISGAPGGAAYGELTWPIQVGSGGGSSYAGPGGAGGGAIKIIAGGLLRIDGRLVADGRAATNSRAGGGSGGSIWLSAQTLTGTGSVSANGGAGEPSAGGSGAGGKIALFFQSNAFTGSINAFGGRGASAGGAGTIYRETAGQTGSLLIDNAGQKAAATPISGTNSMSVSVQNGGVLSVQGIDFSFAGLTVGSNGWVSLSGAARLAITNDAIIEHGGAIIADGSGYSGGTGPGAGRSVYSTNMVGGGGGHGGFGAMSLVGAAAGGGCYGQVQQPDQAGSGGGDSLGGLITKGGSGGGVIRLVVDGNLTLHGRISADGQFGLGPGSGGGSGGSIWMTAGRLMGSGVISASGGSGNGYGGGGGGGRIAVYSQQNGFSGQIKALGAGSGTNYGGAGTVYVKTGDAVPELVIDNAGHRGSTSLPNPPTEPVNLTLLNGVALVPSGALVLSSLSVASNALISLANSPIFVTNSAYVAQGGGISADASGYSAGQGQGAGRTAYFYPPGGASIYTGGGGGHGGYGASSALGAQGGTTYDLPQSATGLGSGGGGYASGGGGPYGGGSGGGLVRLIVSNTLTLHGRITANGQTAFSVNNGGGSGGSIWITAGQIEGGGVVSADGGSGNGLGGGGGGGRIMIYSPTNLFTGSLTAYGGGATTNVGGPGTVYIKPAMETTAPAWATLSIDNGGKNGTNSAAIMSLSSFHLAVRGGAAVPANSSFTVGNLHIASNSWLLMSNRFGSITVLSNATVDRTGGILADGAGYAGNQGPGAGRSYTYGSSYPAGGGGHGGCGGIGAHALAYGGTAYDVTQSPNDAGSGGGNGGGTNYGGPGGGVITLNVQGVLELNGSLSANGKPGNNPNSGGGAGGSIRVTADVLVGSGLILANGAAGSGVCGGGGGGRISLNTHNPPGRPFEGLVTAYGGPGYTRGGAGTIFRLDSQQIGSVLVDNGGARGTNTFITDSFSCDVTVKGGATLAAPFFFSSWRHLLIDQNSSLLFSNQNLTLSGDLTVQPGGTIIADGTGYGPTQGQGAGRSYNTETYRISGGGGYGGYGGANPSGAGRSYGSFRQPVEPGSGGANGSGTSVAPFGGAGGGCVRITLSPVSTLTVDGRISANGKPGDSNSGGGSGGSIFITAGLLKGSGLICANGGAGNGLGGGGGGGRIEIAFRTNQMAGPIIASGGTGYAPGGAGTVFLRPLNYGTAQLLIDNAGAAGTITTLGPSASSGFDLTLQNGALLSIAGAQTIENLVILPGSWLAFSNYNGTSLLVNRNAQIHPGAGIIADGMGYPMASGPGAGGSTSSLYGTIGGGGGHAGFGAAGSAGGRGGLTYDSITDPTFAGSGGGTGYGSAFYNPGGAGGGVIAFRVVGALENNGRISAEGQAGPGQNSGGGAGGTIRLTFGTLTGSGLVSANGGSGNGLGGGGSGGCIRLFCASNLFAGTLTAAGGPGGAGAGGAGTIYLPQNGTVGGQVILDNRDQSGTNTPLAFNGPLDLSVRNGALAYPSSDFLVLSNLVVGSGGILTSLATQTNLDIAVLGDLLIETNGQLNVDGRGFAQGAGPGAGFSTNAIGSGAGHGGAGGASSLLEGGITYGSAEHPLDRGSGGGGGYGSLAGSAGGGAIRLNVAGTLTVDGRVNADGFAGLGDDAGGGSGGSVLITAGTIAGKGTVTASGGAGELFQGGGGGGGRIAVYARTNAFEGQLLAAGAPGWSWGENGSIFQSSTLDAPLIVAHSPTGTISDAVSQVDLHFNNAPNRFSVDYSKFTLLTPSGVADTGAAAYSGGTSLSFHFPASTEVGQYTVIALEGFVTDLLGQPLSQSYTGVFSVSLPQIQGVVTNLNGEPVPGVLVRPSLGSPALTDANGFYSLGAAPNTDLTVTPWLGSLVFVPGARIYSDVTSSITGQDFLAVPTIIPDVSWQQQGTNILASWIGTAGVSYQWYFSDDLIFWNVYGSSFTGINGPMQDLLPIGPEPARFYRLGASN